MVWCSCDCSGMCPYITGDMLHMLHVMCYEHDAAHKQNGNDVTNHTLEVDVIIVAGAVDIIIFLHEVL
jgi:hypothetical protein